MSTHFTFSFKIHVKELYIVTQDKSVHPVDDEKLFFLCCQIKSKHFFPHWTPKELWKL